MEDTTGATSWLVPDPDIRAVFAALEEQGILRFRCVLYVAGAGDIYVFDYRCRCPDAPWREMRMPEWKVRAEFVLR